MEYIYKITNTINEKFYIGKTKNINIRWSQHKSKIGKKRHPLYDAMLKYGIENFNIEIVDGTNEDINELERIWINKTNAIELGYNFTDGGTGGNTFTNRSEESKNVTKELISKKSKISNEKNKKTHSDNTKKLWENDFFRKKITNSMKDIWKNEEYINNMSNKMKIRWQDDDYRTKVSDGLKIFLSNPEKRELWSKVKSGSLNGRWIGYVIIIDVTGNETKYESAVEASKILGMSEQRIRENCKKNLTYIRGPYKGWKFRFEK